jgi:hypothetical protein
LSESPEEEGFVMARKPKEIDFDAELEQQVAKLRARIGQEVPLSYHYVRGVKPVLVAIDGELATLRFPNGTVMTKVPIRYLCDDSVYWRS